MDLQIDTFNKQHLKKLALKFAFIKLNKLVSNHKKNIKINNYNYNEFIHYLLFNDFFFNFMYLFCYIFLK
jgi:hypothetical protein